MSLVEPQINRNYYAKLPLTGILERRCNGEDKLDSGE